MKHRVLKVVNFVAFNLLFFSVYLNFIHKENQIKNDEATKQNSAVVAGTVLVESPSKYLKQGPLTSTKLSSGYNELEKLDQKNTSTELTSIK